MKRNFFLFYLFFIISIAAFIVRYNRTDMLALLIALAPIGGLLLMIGVYDKVKAYPPDHRIYRKLFMRRLGGAIIEAMELPKIWRERSMWFCIIWFMLIGILFGSAKLISWL